MKLILPLILMGALSETSWSQTVTDIGASATPSGTYSQPQHGGSGGTDGANADTGVGEEITLSGSDPTLELTDIIVKSSGMSNPVGSQNITFSLNLYNITTSNEIQESFSSVSVANGDYLDFAVNLTQPQGLLVGGDTYAFSLTTNVSYFMGGILKSNESPNSGFLPIGVTSEFAVSGNGAVNSLTEIGGTSTPADATYFLITEAIPEPQPIALGLLSLVVLLAVRKFGLFRARVS